MKRRIKPVAIFAAVLAFLLLSLPANHSEAEDAYHYARMTEQGAWTEMFHAHHLLYLPLTRAVYRTAQLAGYSGRALPVLIGVSMLCGAWAVGLLFSILRRAGVGKALSALFAGALLFSYGFWRYSTTAEIYIPVTALSLLTVYGCVRGVNERKFFWCGAAAGGLALLLHLVAIPAVLMAAPLFYLLKGKAREAAGHAAAALLLAGAGYLAVVAAGIEPGIYQDTLAPRGTLLEPLTWLKAAVACGQTVLSGNFLFSLPQIAERLIQLFPFHMLQEELFAGEQAAPWIRRAAPVTFGLAFGLAAGLAAVLIRSLVSCPERVLRCLRSPETAAVLVWAAGLAGMALLFEPANPEMWIAIGAPLWLLAALLWHGAGPETGRSRSLPVLLTAALLLHNGIGGMAVVRSAEGDYCRQKGLWIIEHSLPGDVILTAESHSFVTFLQYCTPATVLDAKFVSMEQFREVEQASPGRVFVFDDLFTPLTPVRLRPPESLRTLQELADSLENGLRPVHSSVFGVLYQFSR